MARAKNPDYCRYFKHFITGKRYDAHDYGHKAWPIGREKK